MKLYLYVLAELLVDIGFAKMIICNFRLVKRKPAGIGEGVLFALEDLDQMLKAALPCYLAACAAALLSRLF